MKCPSPVMVFHLALCILGPHCIFHLKCYWRNIPPAPLCLSLFSIWIDWSATTLKPLRDTVQLWWKPWVDTEDPPKILLMATGRTPSMDGNNSGMSHVAQSDLRPGGSSSSALCHAPLPLDALCQPGAGCSTMSHWSKLFNVHFTWQWS